MRIENDEKSIQDNEFEVRESIEQKLQRNALKIERLKHRAAKQKKERLEYQKQAAKRQENRSLLVSALKDFHRKNLTTTHKILNTLSKTQLVNDFIIEMDAKNMAYYFILETGLLQEFREYSLNN